MKFDYSQTQALKDFVIHLLRNCPGNSADEDILADYVIALLKYDKPRTELRRLCSSQLDDFLKEETQPFVTKLFQALSTEEYLGQNNTSASGSRPSRDNVDLPENNAEHSRPRSVNGSPHEDESMNRRRQEKSPDASLHPANQRSLSPRGKPYSTTQGPTDMETQDDQVPVDEKKRRRPEESGPQSEEPSRASKMQRPSLPPQSASGPRANPGSSHQHSGHQNYGPSAQQHRRPDMSMSRGDHMGPGIVRPMHPMQGRGTLPQWPHGGPNVNMSGQQRIPAAPRGMPSGMGGGHPQDQPRGGGRKPRCRDYDERGFCIRGETCPFDHGQDRIIDDASLARPMHYNPAAFQNMAGIPGNMRPPFFVPMGGPPFEGMMGNMNRVPMPVGPDGSMQGGAISSARGPGTVTPLANPLTPPQPNYNARGGIRVGGFRGNGRARGGRGGSFGPRANFQTQKGFTLLVENIPENHCAIDKVNDFFKKFGTVTNIQVDPQNSKALVQFSNNAEAYKAYSSPEPIFDNRFVRVFWHEKEKEPSSGENPQTTSSPSAPGSDVSGPAATVAAHAAHLAEMNAAREEKARARKEQMEKMMEVQKQKEALIQKQIEEQKLLMEAMSKNLNIPEKEKAELMRRLESVANSVLPNATTTTTTATATSSQLGVSTRPPSAKLAEEKERERLDRELDLLSKMGDKGPQNSSTEVTEALQAKLDQLKAEAASLGVSEYTFRGGRGGGAYRARGRGSFRGRGFAAATGFKPYSLDLRPTKILIKSVPASVQPRLKEHFERYGDVESISTDGGTGNAIVHYKTRHEAEKAFYNGGKFDDVSEKLELSWYQDNVVTQSSPSTVPTNRNPNSNVVASSSSSSHVHMEDVRMRSDAGAESDDDDEDGERNWKRGI